MTCCRKCLAWVVVLGEISVNMLKNPTVLLTFTAWLMEKFGEAQCLAPELWLFPVSGAHREFGSWRYLNRVFSNFFCFDWWVLTGQVKWDSLQASYSFLTVCSSACRSGAMSWTSPCSTAPTWGRTTGATHSSPSSTPMTPSFWYQVSLWGLTTPHQERLP